MMIKAKYKQKLAILKLAYLHLQVMHKNYMHEFPTTFREGQVRKIKKCPKLQNIKNFTIFKAYDIKNVI